MNTFPPDPAMNASTTRPQAVIDRFESGGFAEAPFRHADHVQLGWAFLRRHPLSVALAGFAETLQKFATTKGNPGLYHETITWAYLMIIHDRMHESTDGGSDWNEFAATNSDLFGPWDQFLSRWYELENLRSDRARAAFMFPDGR